MRQSEQHSADIVERRISIEPQYSEMCAVPSRLPMRPYLGILRSVLGFDGCQQVLWAEEALSNCHLTQHLHCNVAELPGAAISCRQQVGLYVPAVYNDNVHSQYPRQATMPQTARRRPLY